MEEDLNKIIPASLLMTLGVVLVFTVKTLELGNDMVATYNQAANFEDSVKAAFNPWCYQDNERVVVDSMFSAVSLSVDVSFEDTISPSPGPEDIA